MKRRLRPLLAVVLCTAAAAAVADSALDRVRRTGVLKVCIWPDYYGVTYRNPRTGQLSGIDIDLSAAFAEHLKARIEYIESTFQSLINDVTTQRCDIAMFAIGMLPQRKEKLRFSEPYLQSGIYAVTTRSSRTVRQWSDIDRPGVIVAVQAGTFMEPAMAAYLKQARLVSIKPPASRERELEAGRVDVFMTDYSYSRRLLDNADWATLVAPPEPFHVLPYAYATRLNDEPWAAVVDEFVRRIKRDGRLAAAARRHGLSEIVVP